ncbi:hypothetical protein DSO57_1024547 [Entomophthora muscae]|uniref:Uncharacterized protein n=1 Tax=Entomophthora muscae TaxID=34485 RepID=A0ACC2UNW8_9FUNG|nr:hypothetical protein DSO57_1024547 [Entomophthora muscae]
MMAGLIEGPRNQPGTPGARAQWKHWEQLGRALGGKSNKEIEAEIEVGASSMGNKKASETGSEASEFSD